MNRIIGESSISGNRVKYHRIQYFGHVFRQVPPVLKWTFWAFYAKRSRGIIEERIERWLFQGVYPVLRQFGILTEAMIMNVTRWLMFAVVVLGGTWAKADSVPPSDGHYLIDLEAWDPDQDFNFIPNAVIPPADEISPCLPVGNICGDASIRIDNGGHSTPESGDYSFSSGPNGSVILYFENTGPAFTSAEVTTILNTDELGDDFECSGGALFQACGFVEVDPPSGIELDTYFYDPYNPTGVPTVSGVPEPSQWAFMLLAFAGIIVARVRKQSASLSFAQTQRSACPNQDS
jgi:hypothetical protein